MELTTIEKVPPILPAQWSSSYISYWQPMKPEDHITSGYCWFDYNANICRIDGLFNPWSEAQTGHRLWMSEIMRPKTSESFKTKVAYTRQSMTTVGEFDAEVLNDETGPCHELILEQDILQRCNAEFIGTYEVLGYQTDAWTFQRLGGKGLATYYFISGTNHLIRMVTGDPNVLASVRDFPNFNTLAIADETFTLTPLKQ